MPLSTRHVVLMLALGLAAGALSACGTINEKLANGMGDYIPQWLGGLPPDAPPRPGTPKYEEFMKERELKRLQPAPANQDAAKSDPAALEPIH